MAYYAFIGYENKVVKVITGVDETITQLDGDVEVGGSSEAWEQFYQNQPWHEGLICKRTSYNGNIRKQYGHIGYRYDAVADVFISPRPFNSWTLDNNHDWQPPVPMPTGNELYEWNETELNWVPVTALFENEWLQE